MYIVTGGAGFIGSTLCQSLLEAGKGVTIIDNLATGATENIPKGARFLNASSGDIARLGLRDVEGIYHLGIASSSPMYRADRKLTGKMIDEFINVAEFAVAHKVKLVFASTSSLYSALPTPHSEELVPKALDFYTEARYMMERLAEVYEKTYGLDWCGLRLFSVYGERERAKGQYANLISQFIWDAQAGRTIKIYGDGTQTRDFTYAGDTVRGFQLAMGKGKGVYNIGTGQAQDLNAMIKIVENEMGGKMKVERVDNPIKNYVQHTLADTTKAEKELGFKAEVSLDEGIKRLVAHYKG